MAVYGTIELTQAHVSGFPDMMQAEIGGWVYDGHSGYRVDYRVQLTPDENERLKALADEILARHLGDQAEFRRERGEALAAGMAETAGKP